MDTRPIPLIMTRPVRGNARFIAGLHPSLRQRLRVIASPLMEVVPLIGPHAVEPRDATIFTSANGVRFAPPGEGRQAFCVGRHTTATAKAAGWQATLGGETSDALVATLLSMRPAASLWHLGGRHTRGQVAERLRAGGLTARHMAVYDQALKPLSDEARAVMARQTPVIVPLFSPRTALWFAGLCPPRAGLHVIALSKAVAASLRDCTPDSLDIAARPDAQAMVDCLEKVAGRISLG